MNVMIIGAGSAGTHLAHACWSLGLDVFLYDTAKDAGSRFYDLYYERYNQVPPDNMIWSELITRCDLYIIATPPATHLHIATKICEMEENPKILVEKPLCLPGEVEAFDKLNAQICVNYNHLFSPAWEAFMDRKLFTEYLVNEDVTPEITINWKESDLFIQQAHPWVEDWDSHYLRDPKQGGGCAMEHSHGLACLFAMLPEAKIGNKVIKGDVDHHTVMFTANGIPVVSRTDFLSDTPEKTVVCRRGEFFKKIDFSRPGEDIAERHGNGVDSRGIVAKTRPEEFIRGVEGALAQWDNDSPVDTYLVAKRVLEVLS